MSQSAFLGYRYTIFANVPNTLTPYQRVYLAATAGTPGELKPCSNSIRGIGTVPYGAPIATTPIAVEIFDNTPGTRSGLWSGATPAASGAVLYAGNNGVLQAAPDSGAGLMVAVAAEASTAAGAPIQFKEASAV